MSEITSMLLGNGSVVYDECVIHCQELPMGSSILSEGRSYHHIDKRIRTVCCDEDMRAAIPLSSLFHDNFCDHIHVY
jgi:hypothetical protein